MPAWMAEFQKYLAYANPVLEDDENDVVDQARTAARSLPPAALLTCCVGEGSHLRKRKPLLGEERGGVCALPGALRHGHMGPADAGGPGAEQGCASHGVHPVPYHAREWRAPHVVSGTSPGFRRARARTCAI